MTDKQNEKNSQSEFDMSQLNEAREMLAPFQAVSPTESAKEKWLITLDSRKDSGQNIDPILPPRCSKRRIMEIALAACLGFGLSSFLQHFSNQSAEQENNFGFDATEVHYLAKSE
jgi:hypothetical protein